MRVTHYNKKAKPTKSVLFFLLVLFNVWLNRTVFFGNVYFNITRLISYVLIAISLLMIPISVSKSKAVIQKMLPIMLAFGCNFLTCYSLMNRTNINAVLGAVLTMVCSAITVVQIEKETFAKFYIRIIFVYAVISLPCYFVQINFPDVAQSLCQPGYDWTSGLGYSFFHTWGRNGTIYPRNAGPFWEPGGYQCFLNIAILLLLYNVDHNGIRRRRLVLCILCLTVLTTKSTAGYIVFALILITQNGRIVNTLFQRSVPKQYLLITIFIALIIISLVLLPTAYTKISDEDNESMIMREADVADGMTMILKAGPFGLGETNQRNQLRRALELYRDDSAGLVNLTYTYGWLMGLVYLLLLGKIPKDVFGCRFIGEKFAIFVILFILHMTQGLWSLPLFWCLLFFY